jgi:hypothetical protein
MNNLIDYIGEPKVLSELEYARHSMRIYIEIENKISLNSSP